MLMHLTGGVSTIQSPSMLGMKPKRPGRRLVHGMGMGMRLCVNQAENISRRGIAKRKKGNMANYVSSFIQQAFVKCFAKKNLLK